ncbi:glycosyltransferase family 2 protein [Paenibacillus sp. FSL H7-0331]|uniref:glycosyltransferase family 2 protein n=1 Tax=Paenibacillus sp. FSL H7-0331 TaxID=1920421 RepID=UPI00096C2A40|nr:glycosyltransferase family 2 protein [Paenibacillus sp. FSL H7-0331]OMF14767.1 glycosyl transferase family 2 [Paenibacillus sp. FSL H7-0331]
MKMTSMIISNRNGLPLLRRCIHSIQKYTDIPYEIIVVDGGSTDGSVEYCRQQQVRFISTPSSRGFTRSHNLGLHLGSGDALLLLNNDVVASPRWLSNLLNCLYSSEEIGIVGPVTRPTSSKQMADMPISTPKHSPEMINLPDSRKWQSVERLAGFCFLIKRELVERIGFLDEQFPPGYFEDDYCYRARLSGYRLLMAGDTFVFDLGNASHNKEDNQQVLNQDNPNEHKFVQKWGVDPRSFVRIEGGDTA